MSAKLTLSLGLGILLAQPVVAVEEPSLPDFKPMDDLKIDKQILPSRPSASEQSSPLTKSGQIGSTRYPTPKSSTPSITSRKTLSPTGNKGDWDWEPYMLDLRRKIKEAWYPPKGEETRRIKCRFNLSKTGNVTNVVVHQSSKLAVADNAAIRAIYKASPFPSLPSEAPDDIDIEFTFDYNVYLDSIKLKTPVANSTDNEILPWKSKVVFFQDYLKTLTTKLTASYKPETVLQPDITVFNISAKRDGTIDIVPSSDSTTSGFQAGGQAIFELTCQPFPKIPDDFPAPVNIQIAFKSPAPPGLYVNKDPRSDYWLRKTEFSDTFDVGRFSTDADDVKGWEAKVKVGEVVKKFDQVLESINSVERGSMFGTETLTMKKITPINGIVSALSTKLVRSNELHPFLRLRSVASDQLNDYESSEQRNKELVACRIEAPEELSVLVHPFFEAYLKEVDRILKAHWTAPISDAPKNASVLFTISPLGKMSGLKIGRSSGDQMYDDVALRAVKNEAANLPVPPKGLVENITIEFTFSYNPNPARRR